MAASKLSSHSIAKRLSLREQIGSSLRAALINGEMLPGETYSVPLLAEKFGVSATPVREAVLDLTKEGILVALANKGFRVIETSNETLVQLTEIRMLLEISTTVEIGKTISKQTTAELREIAHIIQEYAVAEDLLNFIEMDRQFHHEILALSGNPLLVELADQLRSRARIHALPFIVASGQLVTSASEHLALLKAMDKRDLKMIATVVEHHINYTVEAVKAMGRVQAGK